MMALPVASAAWTIRRLACPPSRIRCRSPESAVVSRGEFDALALQPADGGRGLPDHEIDGRGPAQTRSRYQRVGGVLRG